MASFTDKKGGIWRVELDAPTIEEINQDVGVNLVDIDKDPLGQLAADPMKLWPVMMVVCREEREERSIDRMAFGKLLAADSMLEALQEAIVNFFPTGRASFVRDQLAKFEKMKTKTQDLQLSKMQQVLDDPEVMKTLSTKADQAIRTAIQEMGQKAGTP